MSWDLIFQHLFIVLAASLLSIAVGLPLGIWAYVSKTARPVILRYWQKNFWQARRI